MGGAGCSLFRVFGGDRIKGLMKIFQIEDLPIESKMLTDALTEAQRKVEAYFFGEILLSASHSLQLSGLALSKSFHKHSPCQDLLPKLPVQLSSSCIAFGSVTVALCGDWGVRRRSACACADIRKQLWEYDQVLNTQRDKVYAGPAQGPGLPGPLPAHD